MKKTKSMPIPVRSDCSGCGSLVFYSPTFCNHTHCAECFEPRSSRHECSWDGSEHSSYFPQVKHGNVFNASCSACRDLESPCDSCQKPLFDSKSHVVAVYAVSRQYGGPEEGGWWYDTGELVRQVKVFRTKDAADAYAERLSSHLHRRIRHLINTGRTRSYSSVLGGTEYSVQVYDSPAPLGFPTNAPHYE